MIGLHENNITVSRWNIMHCLNNDTPPKYQKIVLKVKYNWLWAVILSGSKKVSPNTTSCTLRETGQSKFWLIMWLLRCVSILLSTFCISFWVCVECRDWTHKKWIPDLLVDSWLKDEANTPCGFATCRTHGEIFFFRSKCEVQMALRYYRK